MNKDVDVLFAMPSYYNQAVTECWLSLLRSERNLFAHGVRADYLVFAHDPYISKVRSKLACIFLEEFPNAKHLFFIDDDVGFPYKKTLEYIHRPEDIVAGVYPKKSDGLEFPMVLARSKETKDYLRHDKNYIRAAMAPTGFMCIKRHVIEKIAENAPPFLDVKSVAGELVTFKSIFKQGQSPDGHWYGEDVIFCMEAMELGFEIYVDSDAMMSHRGSRIWQARVADYLDKPVDTPPEIV